jgi:hypothetical protein
LQENPLTYQRDGGEVIFKLPNGLLAYALYDSTGKAIDKAPTAVVSDPARPDRAVENGISCMRCHANGYIPKSDEVGPYVKAHSSEYGPGVAEAVSQRYNDAEQQRLMSEDQKTLTEAIKKTGSLNLQKDTVTRVVSDYDAPLTLTKAAAELGAPPALLAEVFKGSNRFRNLASLAQPGNTISRDNFNALYKDAQTQIAAFQKACLEASKKPAPEGAGQVPHGSGASE